MLRYVLLMILVVFVARAFWRVLDGVVEGVTGQGRQGRKGGVPQHGVQMARDPVCGTHVIPDRALSLSDGQTKVFFCSRSCRDKYRAGHA